VNGGFGLDKTHVSSNTRHMGLDADLVRDAEAARARLLVAQHAAEQARADYHHAIRRLHAAGGSLREIAEALRLSHQRVHQIIDEAAEPARPWWRRRGRRRGPMGPCSFCGRSREECAKLIAGPGVFVCDRCVARATRLSVGGVAVADWTEAPMRLEPSDSQATCSFCGKQARQVGFLVAGRPPAARGGKFGQDARICDECLDLCLAILAETAS
jgi:ClpX C4-type zinc finger